MQQRYDVSITTVIYWVTAPITHKLKKSIVEKVCGDLYALNKWANFLFISWSEKIMLLSYCWEKLYQLFHGRMFFFLKMKTKMKQ